MGVRGCDITRWWHDERLGVGVSGGPHQLRRLKPPDLDERLGMDPRVARGRPVVRGRAGRWLRRGHGGIECGVPGRAVQSRGRQGCCERAERRERDRGRSPRRRRRGRCRRHGSLRGSCYDCTRNRVTQPVRLLRTALSSRNFCSSSVRLLPQFCGGGCPAILPLLPPRAREKSAPKIHR